MNVNCISTVRNALDPHLSIEADDIVYVSLKNRLVSLFDRPDDVPAHRVSFAKFAEEILYPSRVRDEGEEEVPVFEEIDDGVYQWRKVAPAWHDIDAGVSDGFIHYCR